MASPIDLRHDRRLPNWLRAQFVDLDLRAVLLQASGVAPGTRSWRSLERRAYDLTRLAEPYLGEAFRLQRALGPGRSERLTTMLIQIQNPSLQTSTSSTTSSDGVPRASLPKPSGLPAGAVRQPTLTAVPIGGQTPTQGQQPTPMGQAPLSPQDLLDMLSPRTGDAGPATGQTSTPTTGGQTPAPDDQDAGADGCSTCGGSQGQATLPPWFYGQTRTPAGAPLVAGVSAEGVVSIALGALAGGLAFAAVRRHRRGRQG